MLVNSADLTFMYISVINTHVIRYTDDSLLTDTSITRTPRVGSFFNSFYLILYIEADITLRWTLCAGGHKGIRFRESLYIFFV